MPTAMMLEYVPRLVEHLAQKGMEDVRDTMNSYFNGIYPDLQRHFWKAVSVSVFVKQISDMAVEIFPDREKEIRGWERTEGEDVIKRYSE